MENLQQGSEVDKRVFCEGALPFEVVAGRPTEFSIGGTPVGKFSIECCMGF